MGLAIGIDIPLGGGAGGGTATMGDFILTEDGQKISTENYEPLIQE
jgi:hypothetical protein